MAPTCHFSWNAVAYPGWDSTSAMATLSLSVAEAARLGVQPTSLYMQVIRIPALLIFGG